MVTFPNANKLGQDALVTAELEEHPRVPKRGFNEDFTFESWLSLLSEEQPHLDEVENAENTWMFKKLLVAIVQDLGQASDVAFSKGLPPWLYELLSVLHHRRSTIISFNYDTVIETGVETSYLFNNGSNSRVGPQNILRDLPPPANPEHRIDAYDSTFRLLKLHGSLDWWWVPSDASGATLSRSTLSRYDNLGGIFERLRRQRLPGRAPFIVPPSATKSVYFQNPVTRELWRSAYEALQSADRITMIGYSMSPGDVVMSGLLASAIGERREQPIIEVVDLHPEKPRKRLIGLGADPEKVIPYKGDDCVESFARRFTDRAAREYADELRSTDPTEGKDVALNVAVGAHASGETPAVFRVTRISSPSAEGHIELTFDRSVHLHPTSKGAPDTHPVSGERLPTAEDFIRAAQTASKINIREEGSSNLSAIIGWWWQQWDVENHNMSAWTLAMAPTLTKTLPS